MRALVFGGAACGKSAFAEGLCCARGGRVLYVATMERAGADAEARIERWELMAQKLRVVLMPLSTQSDMIEQLREYLNAQRPRSAS